MKHYQIEPAYWGETSITKGGETFPVGRAFSSEIDSIDELRKKLPEGTNVTVASAEDVPPEPQAPDLNLDPLSPGSDAINAPGQ